jgi:hypothetical protein
MCESLRLALGDNIPSANTPPTCRCIFILLSAPYSLALPTAPSTYILLARSMAALNLDVFVPRLTLIEVRMSEPSLCTVTSKILRLAMVLREGSGSAGEGGIWHM